MFIGIHPFWQVADAGDAEAALREVAADTYCENPNGLLLRQLSLRKTSAPCQGLGFRIQGPGLGFRVQGLGFRVGIWVGMLDAKDVEPQTLNPKP